MDEALHAGVVGADDVHAVEGHLVHEGDEGVVDGFLRAVVVHMVVVHVGHHVDDREEAEE